MSVKSRLIAIFVYFLTGCFPAVADQASGSEHFGYGKIYSGLQGGWGKAFELGCFGGDGDGRKAEFVAIFP